MTSSHVTIPVTSDPDRKVFVTLMSMREGWDIRYLQPPVIFRGRVPILHNSCSPTSDHLPAWEVADAVGSYDKAPTPKEE